MSFWPWRGHKSHKGQILQNLSICLKRMEIWNSTLKRAKEHRDKAEKVTRTIKTRSKSVTEPTDDFKSACAKHMRDHNHIMDWDNIKILTRESVPTIRKMRETCRVRMLDTGVAMNGDEGGYELSHIWDPLIRPALQPPAKTATVTPARARHAASDRATRPADANTAFK